MSKGRRGLLPLVAGVALAASACSMSTVSPSPSDPAFAAGAATAQPTATPWETVKLALAPTGPTENAKVVRIVDGDTIVVSLDGTNQKLRYIGMDTPEDVDPDSPVEPMSREAAAANSKLVSGKTVVLEKDVSETDQYGRLLRYVWLHQGPAWTLVNLELVRLGYATALRYPPDVKYADLFDSAEPGASSSLLGIWSVAATPAPTPEATPRPTPKPTPRPTPSRRRQRRTVTRPIDPACRSSATSTARTFVRWASRPFASSAQTTTASTATTTGWGVSRGTRAVLYFFFAVVSPPFGSAAISLGFIGGFGGSVTQPVAEIYGSLVRLVAVVAPILFVIAAFYALLFGKGR